MGRGDDGVGGGPPGMAGGGGRGIKPDGGVWVQHGRNGSWDETGPGWDESGPWNKQKMTAPPLWDGDNDWEHKQGPKATGLSKEMIWNSKFFRVLVEMNYKVRKVGPSGQLYKLFIKFNGINQQTTFFRAALAKTRRRKKEKS